MSWSDVTNKFVDWTELSMLRWCPCDVVASVSFHEHFADLRSSSLPRRRALAKCSERQSSTPSSWCQYPWTSDYSLGCLCSVSSVFLWAWNLAEARSRRQFSEFCDLACLQGDCTSAIESTWLLLRRLSYCSAAGLLCLELYPAIWFRLYDGDSVDEPCQDCGYGVCLYSVHDSQPCSRDVKTTAL